MGKKRLTIKAAEALTEPGMHPDGDAPGLYLRVAPGGSKSWILRTLVQGVRRDLGLGGFPTTTIAEAREEARRLRAIARRGGDPLEGRRRTKTLTFEEAARIVHEKQVVPTARNAKHRAQWLNTLEQYAFPSLGSMPVDVVSSADVLKVLSAIWVQKPETARRVRQRLQTVFAWALQAGHRTTSNPVENVATALPRQREKVQHFSAMPWNELPAFFQLLQQQTSMSAYALRFLILNAARTGEVIGARWGEFDLANAIWTIPPARMKTKTEHRKPLCQSSLETLKRIEGLDPEFVFPGAAARKPLSNMAMLALMKRMDFAQYTVHGFRTSFRVWAAEQTDAPREIAEMCLAHDIRGDVEQAYARTDYFEQRRLLMQKWEEWCASAKGLT